MNELFYHPVVVYLALACLRVPLLVWAEARYGRYRIEWRRVLGGDLASLVFLLLVATQISDAVHYRLQWRGLAFPALDALAALPLAVRVLLYLLLADLGHYLIHRLMHTAPLWRLHRWHHLPDHMGWLAGNRESIPDKILVSLPYFFFWPVLEPAPPWLAAALLGFAVLKNDWMHLNVRQRFGRLEWVLVTPAMHHIHHSEDPEHANRNLAPLFSFWDRLGGTYLSPDSLDREQLRFGIRERVPLYRLMVGL